MVLVIVIILILLLGRNMGAVGVLADPETKKRDKVWSRDSIQSVTVIIDYRCILMGSFLSLV